MKQIKFRGFRTDGKGQLIGDLNHIDGKVYIFPRDGSSVDSYDAYEVNPKSLAMFTGLTDKNGKEIFGSIDGSKGGDIVQIGGLIENVEYINGILCCYSHKIYGKKDKITIEDVDDGNTVNCFDYFEPYEIIGNQYENQ